MTPTAGISELVYGPHMACDMVLHNLYKINFTFKIFKKKIRKEYCVAYENDIKLNSVSTHMVLLEHSHAHGFTYH